MKVLIPVAIGEPALLQSSLPETDHPAWLANTTYAADARCVHQHRIWISARANNVNQEPGKAKEWWVDERPTNRWAMFDQSPGTTSSATGSLSVTLRPKGWVNAVALLAITCRTARVQVLAADGSTVLFDRTQDLPGITRTSWHAWFMRDRFRVAGDLVFENLPRRVTGSIVVTLRGPGAVSLGVLVAGVQHNFGMTVDEAESGLVDHSRVLIDDFGGVSITRRGTSRTGRFSLLIFNHDLPRIVALREAVSSLPCVWSGTDARHLRSALLAYGLATRMPITVKGLVHATAALEIQGFA